jgi:two-component system nitrate/nitrite response regulator NarL
MVDLPVLDTIRIAVVDDHRLLAQMLVDHLMDQGFSAMVAHVDDPGLPETLRGLEPDLILLDAVFHDDEDGGLQVLEAMADDDIRVAMLTGVDDDLRHAEFLDAGAVAVISKTDSFAGVLDQVGDVINGIDPHGCTRRQDLARLLTDHRCRRGATDDLLRALTGRERATLQALVDGHSVDAIAAARTVAPSTVRSQVRAVLRKLDAHSQIEAVALAARSGMAPTAD